jgi:hypothetical protein
MRYPAACHRFGMNPDLPRALNCCSHWIDNGGPERTHIGCTCGRCVGVQVSAVRRAAHLTRDTSLASECACTPQSTTVRRVASGVLKTQRIIIRQSAGHVRAAICRGTTRHHKNCIRSCTEQSDRSARYKVWNGRCADDEVQVVRTADRLRAFLQMSFTDAVTGSCLVIGAPLGGDQGYRVAPHKGFL